MKRFLWFWVMSFGLSSLAGCAATRSPSQAAQARSPPTAEWTASGLVVRRVAPQTWVVTDPSVFNANSLVAEMPDGTLLIADTPPTTDATDRLIAGLRRHFGQSRKLVAINGHFHLDASGGNHAIVQAGGRVYGSTQTAALLSARGERMRAGLARMLRGTPGQRWFERTRLVPPTHTFEKTDGATLGFGDEAVEVIYPGEAHSSDNIVVFLPSRGVLFGGCMVIGMKRVGYTGDANLGSWPRAIEALKRLAPKVVVPGHGFRVDAGLLDHTLRLLRNYERPRPRRAGSSAHSH